MFSWTPENVEQLKHSWGAGKSAAVIAGALGITRNAVIGKVFRLDLNNRKTVESVRPRPKQKDTPMPVEPLFIPLVDLEPHHCREVVSQDGVIGSFCGHTVKKGSSYCPFHHAINWTPAPARVRPFIRTPVRAA